jgi:hypothetical protein
LVEDFVGRRLGSKTLLVEDLASTLTSPWGNECEVDHDEPLGRPVGQNLK